MTAAPAAPVMQSLDSLKVTPVWVDPYHMVESARVLMDGHDLSAICVLDRDGRPIGTLRRDVAANIPGSTRVGDVMEPVLGVLETSESLRQAADLLVSIERHYAPMVEGNSFRGIITALDLLDGLRRSWDPMTDLPWSDELRRWGAEKLDAGNEIAVIFIDLDRFGTFNKRFGHVIGDRVLRRIAEFLRERVNPELDVLVRYGGDEFAIGTLRSASETQAFADALLRSSSEAPLRESGEVISFSIGVYGGQRQRERDDMHVQATLDDLINLASRRSVANKTSLIEAAAKGVAVVAARVEEPPVPAVIVRTSDEQTLRADEGESLAAPESSTGPESVGTENSPLQDPVPSEEISEPEAFAAPVDVVESESDETPAPGEEESSSEDAIVMESSSDIPRVVEVQIEDDPNSLTHVVLKGGGRVWVGVGLRLGRSLESTVAYATSKALERAYTGRTLRIDAVREDEGRIVVEGTQFVDGNERPVSMIAEDTTPEAVADATIAAFLA